MDLIVVHSSHGDLLSVVKNADTLECDWSLERRVGKDANIVSPLTKHITDRYTAVTV